MSDAHTILVVEDDPDVGDTLRGLLCAFGYQVELASDGNQALRTLRAGLRPSIIVLDLMMPNMDGHRFRELQQQEPELAAVPTIVITADARTSAEKLHAVACLRKPFDPEVLLDIIKRHC